ncbi:MAG: UDP-N-acetylmuramoyl-L-alanine--D-glutamate ligase [Epsilonproteobacteria bacterium]|nr:UDP-N-acetylmuramoyl-L-alanine--D-glutamate ligase [Campylobacterota bacterium]
MGTISLFGYGKTTKAIAKKLNNAIFFDDNAKEPFEENGAKIYPSDMFDPSKSILEIPSPGIPPSNPMIKKAKNLLSDYDYFLPKSKATSVWISGTNGKTTTTKMLYHLLKDKGAQMGGNVGTPLAELDLSSPLLILETSSFTLHYTNIAKPNIYLLLPVDDDHISWHGSFEKYKEAKLKPLKFLKEGEVCIIPEEFKDAKTDGYKITYKNSQDLADKMDIKLSDIKHEEPFLLDAVMALSVERVLFDEISYEKINSFSLDSHRMEKIFDKAGRLWVNDSKGTNVHATLNAIRRYKNKKIYLILGGDDKGADLNPLFKELKECDTHIFAVGSNKEKISKLSKKYSLSHTVCATLKDAVVDIDAKLSKDAVALLSPAASSLDEYGSYKERGELFKRYISELF